MGRKSGTSGPDTLIGGSGRDELNGLGGNDIVRGGGGDDIVSGDEGDDYVYGDDGNDIVLGGPGTDHLFGGAGNDEVQSGSGADYIYGGSGADVFRYRFMGDSSTRIDAFGVTSGVDQVLDFESGMDKLMLSDLDADTTTPVGRRGVGNEAFRLVTSTDGATPGDLTVSYDPSTNITTVNAYSDAIAGADFTIEIVGQINPAVDILF